MRLTIRIHEPGIAADLRGGRHIDVDVDVDGARLHDRTLEDLVRATRVDARAASVDRDRYVTVDGRRFGVHDRLGSVGVHNGSVVEVVTGAASAQGPLAPAVGALVSVSGGLDSGATFVVPHGRHHIGRGHTNVVRLHDPTVSRQHARLQIDPDGAITVTDANSTNGTRVGPTFVDTAQVDDHATITLGATQLRIEPFTADPHRRAGGTTGPGGRIPRSSAEGTTPFNRPPRMAPSPSPAPIPQPAAPRGIGGRTPFSWAMFLAPLAIGLVMAKIFGPMFAVFALLSPVMMVASWFEQSRRARRSSRSGSRAFRQALDAFAIRVAQEHADESSRRTSGAPDLALLHRQALDGDQRLWERRTGHADFLSVRVGTTALPWAPALDPRTHNPPDDAVTEILDAHDTLHDSPLVVDLGPGNVVGVAGPRGVARAVARSLIAQAVAQAGPADLAIRMLAADEHLALWGYLSWLPHVEDLFALSVANEATVTLTVVDDPAGSLDHHVVRGALPAAADDRRSAVVLAGTAAELPSECTAVVLCTDDVGRARVLFPGRGESQDGVLLMGASVGVATEQARSLARYTDPDRDRADAALPTDVALSTLLGHAADDADAIVAAWATHAAESLPITLGVGSAGAVTVDVASDGPHALVGGTTGSGKSELLRSIIAGLVASTSPDDLNLVLIDYKGGSAFDACARLPHTVGLVTDLDEQLGERALISLDAELHRREHQLRSVGADDLPAYRRAATATTEPLPRLVVIIDEFATLAVELPSFLDALVSIAQRGRSLGVHLILATQRPHGVISDNIRTNTNVRVALRMLDDGDSTDVIGRACAAGLPRSRPGRGYVRTGRDEISLFQGARASAPANTTGGGACSSEPDLVVTLLDGCGVPVAPVLVHRSSCADDGRGSDAPADASDRVNEPVGDERDDSDRLGALARSSLDVLVDTVCRVHERRHGRTPRRPWLPALKHPLSVDELAGFAPGPESTTVTSRALASVAIGVVDEPRVQRQRQWAWHPGEGNLLVYGMTGSGTTTCLLTVAMAIAERIAPTDAHIYAFDFGAGGLAPLAALPHTGAVVMVNERARQRRLLDLLHDELSQRRTRGGRPPILVVVDDLGSMRATHDDLAGLRFLERFSRLALDGPALGIHVVLAADRPQAMPPALAAASTQRVVLRLADAYDRGLLGLPGRRPAAALPGRGFTSAGLELQLAHRDERDMAAATAAIVAAAAASVGPGTNGGRHPVSVGVLPDLVTFGDLTPPSVGARVWAIPLGIGDRDLCPRSIDLHEGDHLLVAGPPRSGRTSVLAHVGRSAALAGSSVVVVADRPDTALPGLLSSLDVVSVIATPPDLGDVLARRGEQPTVVLIDDAERLREHGTTLADLVASDRLGVRVVAAGRADRLRVAYGHWTRPMRASRLGLALQPDLEVDGELWSVRFAALRGATWPAGRGVLVRDGEIELIQVALP